ncbi:hypothetical protein QC762_0017830 [Podospora pseudocomata]|uniref:Translation initiation factor 5A C-terminal domain-containing protein n=1 Tax=Podospora pseudocomata TaxID=2093779 RepID=A0ABR0GX35_9PEZI|nr:hypothetical protein QC762_0017830 [Podospora pseudocomata]
MASHEEALIRRPDFKISASIPSPLTVPIPCHHIRLGDILILGGRPCQVIRISTSAANGQHRYLGVDLFTKQLHEESSFVSNPAPSVVVQTMLGPVFKQYRVLDMQDGAIVALTETGDVKQNLPVIDQSSLWNRLQKAFESGRGSVRVLVVTDHGREMAVDMKVVHTSRLFGSRTTHDEHQKKPDVHEASRNGDSSLLRDILRDAPESITLLDTNKRTALFKAIEGRQRESAEILIDAGIDINALDENNISALEFALFNKDSTSQSMALLLLKGGASPVSNLESNGLALLSASAKGDMDTVNRLLANGTSINGQDRLGYTALHEAACFGNLEVAKKLIECGADVNAKTTLGGNTVLHVTIATSSDQQHRLFYEEESGRQKPPQLCSGHVDVVKLLLQYGAVPGLKRLDGLTVQGLLAQQLSALSADDQAQVFLQKILIVVNNPPSAESRTIVEKTYVPPTIPDAAWEVLSHGPTTQCP